MTGIINKYGDIKIKFNKIKPFINICKVTGKKELVNIEIEYEPHIFLIEIGSYRKYFEQKFNMHIEEICDTVFYHIDECVKPKYLSVTVSLEGNKKLTDWSVTKTSKKI